MSTLDLSGLAKAIEPLCPCPESEFTYEPLRQEQSIRLLALQPATSVDEQLKCNLQEVLLSDQPKYEAISYAWGERVFSSELKLPTGSLKITDSLSLALKRFRLQDRVRYLWADAVCINQSDMIEKGKQVTMMGDVYRNCQKVLVWLGPGDEKTGDIIDTFKRAAAQSDRYGIKLGTDGSVLGGWEGNLEPMDRVKALWELQKVPIEYDWSGADEFYSLPWFSRMWIIQEIALAPSAHLYCGAFDISWGDFTIAVHIEFKSVLHVESKLVRLPFNFHHTRFLVEGIRCSKSNPSQSKLLALLVIFCFSDCFDARDRLYSLLSLTNIHDVEVTPDYNKPVTKIYTELAREMLKKNVASFTILHYAGVANRLRRAGQRLFFNIKNTVRDRNSMPPVEMLCKDLPSWVPDWRIVGEYRSFFADRRENSLYATASRFPPSIRFDPKDGSLSVLALTIDTLKAGRGLGIEPELGFSAHREQLLLIKEFYDQQEARLKPTDEDLALTNFSFAIIASLSQGSTRTYLREKLTGQDLRDLWVQFASTPFNAENQDEHFQLGAAAGIGPPTARQETTIKRFTQLFSYRIALKDLLDDRRFIITNAGLVGLAPAIAQPGDRIVVFSGARTPMVVRLVKTDTGEFHFYVIGDCYLHGAMDAKMSDVMKPEDWFWMKLR